jgi:hypothetical protein
MKPPIRGVTANQGCVCCSRGGRRPVSRRPVSRRPGGGGKGNGRGALTCTFGGNVCLRREFGSFGWFWPHLPVGYMGIGHGRRPRGVTGYRPKVRTWSGKSGLFTDLAIYIFTPGRSHLAQFEIRNLACFVVHKVHLWSALGPEKVRKRWTEKTKVRTWSVFSGPCPDLFPRSPQP